MKPKSPNMTEASRLLERSVQAIRLMQWREAEVTLGLMLARWPRNRPALHNLGIIAQATGKPTEAESRFRSVLAMDPDFHEARYGLFLALSAQGRHTEAHEYLSSRHHIAKARVDPINYGRPEWRGERIDGKRLLIFPEQGFGDQIQMARFSVQLNTMGADVTWLCSPALDSLFANSLPVKVLAASGEMELPVPDYWTTTAHLPGLLRLDHQAVGAAQYLKATAPRSGGGIGLVTVGNPRHPNDRNRSLSERDAANLREIIGDPVSLDPRDTGATNFADTADVIAGLDLVITVDTSIAHLAGAIGKEVWVLVPGVYTDWRWGLGDLTPWYPTARLFRSADDGDWSGALAQVRSALRGYPRAAVCG